MKIYDIHTNIVALFFAYFCRLCLPVPIDVVYTWVNGSDPILVSQVRAFKQKLEKELNDTHHETKAVDG